MTSKPVNASDQLERQIERWVRPEISQLKAYPVPPSAGLIKLDAMENPYRWPEDLRQQWATMMQEVALNRYPSPQAEELKAGLRARFGLRNDYGLLLGNGSDELIQLLMMTVSGPGRVVMAPQPGFVMFRMIAEFLHMDFCGVDLDENFDLDMPRLLRAIEAEQPAIIFLAQPNNPTGNLWGVEQLRRVIEAAPGLVVIDEAYTAFTDADYLHLLDDYEHLLVMRTLSKVGLAGLRLGMLMGRPAWLEQIDKVRLPYNINVLTEASARFALEHFPVLEAQTRQIREERERLASVLKELPLARIWPSEANFILVRTPEGQARRWLDKCREQGVLIKCLDGSHPLLQDCLRLTVGTREENDALIAALRQC
ncbi:MAG: histidinol-phosphate transaminase [Natronospirillum sp.]|uniref:histidinol-phosphate transaminase n=1 Tax=Natronospirillum sp. TaxID=2812955 RepID=UPI0025DC1444|nr:histidinol-phosphate transaminase [Natronospirillum sp.]MCH8552260.1 histidinol-phosphate transaminase [Natronospirillum sp.]